MVKAKKHFKGDPKTDNPTRMVTLKLYERKYWDAKLYAYWIQTKTEEGEKIPARVLKKFFKFFKSLEIEEKNEWLINTKIAVGSCGYFLKRMNCDFTIIDGTCQKEYTLKGLLSHVAQMIKQDAHVLRDNKRNKIIKYVYDKVNGYLEELTQQQQPKDSLKYAITGVVVSQVFGLLESEHTYDKQSYASYRRYIYEKVFYTIQRSV